MKNEKCLLICPVSLAPGGVHTYTQQTMFIYDYLNVSAEAICFSVSVNIPDTIIKKESEKNLWEKLLKDKPSIIHLTDAGAHQYKEGRPEYIEIIGRFKEQFPVKVITTIHDPYAEKRFLTWKESVKISDCVFFIRKKAKEYFMQKWPQVFKNKECYFTPHSFKSTAEKFILRPTKLINISRFASTKKQKKIVENYSLNFPLNFASHYMDDKGQIVGGISVYFTVKALKEAIEEKHNIFMSNGFPLVSLTNYSILLDFTIMKNDGEGTQYTFLEAMSKNLVPILHHSWEGELVHRENAIFCDFKDLDYWVDKVDKDQNLQKHITTNNWSILKKHHPSTVAKLYNQILFERRDSSGKTI